MQTIYFDITLRDRQIAGLTLLAIGLHVLETSFPSPLPGVKPGVANIVVLYVCQRYGFSAAASVSMLRVLASSLLFGQLFTPTFFLSFTGAIASLAVLWMAQWLPPRYFSAVSLSVLAALAHVFGQVCLVRWWLIPMPETWYLLAPLWTSALVFGICNGLILVHLGSASGATRVSADCALPTSDRIN